MDYWKALLNILNGLAVPLSTDSDCVIVVYRGYILSEYEEWMKFLQPLAQRKVEVCFKGYILTIDFVGWDRPNPFSVSANDAYSVVIKGRIRSDDATLVGEFKK
jgi:hypothetical protein